MGMVGAVLMMEKTTRNRGLPPGPWGVPVLGAIHRICGNTHLQIQAIAEEYGPVCSFWTGSKLTVIVSDLQTCKDVFSQPEFSDRVMGKILDIFTGGGNDLAMSAYNTNFKTLKSVCHKSLFVSSRIRENTPCHFFPVLCNFLDQILKASQCSWSPSQDGGGGGPTPVDLRSGLVLSNVHMLFRTVFGCLPTGPDKDMFSEFQEVVDFFFENSLTPIIGDYVPLLSWYEPKAVHLMRELAKRKHRILTAFFEKTTKRMGKRRRKNTAAKPQTKQVGVRPCVSDPTSNRLRLRSSRSVDSLPGLYEGSQNDSNNNNNRADRDIPTVVISPANRTRSSSLGSSDGSSSELISTNYINDNTVDKKDDNSNATKDNKKTKDDNKTLSPDGLDFNRPRSRSAGTALPAYNGNANCNNQEKGTERDKDGNLKNYNNNFYQFSDKLEYKKRHKRVNSLLRNTAVVARKRSGSLPPFSNDNTNASTLCDNQPTESSVPEACENAEQPGMRKVVVVDVKKEKSKIEGFVSHANHHNSKPSHNNCLVVDESGKTNKDKGKSRENLAVPTEKKGKKKSEEGEKKSKEEKKKEKEEEASWGNRAALLETLMDMVEDKKLTEAQVEGLVTDIFTAGSDTSAATLTWLMTYYANYPDVQQKVYEEIANAAYGSFPPFQPSQCKVLLPYTHATILEAMRVRSVASLGVPHSNPIEMELEGYRIPANSQLFCNIGGYHKNKKIFPEPEKFKPERWLDGTLDESQLMPFGVGRRMCPGINLAKAIIYLNAVYLTFFFAWSPFEGEKLCEEQEHGIGIWPKVNPLLRASPRPLHLDLLSSLLQNRSPLKKSPHSLLGDGRSRSHSLC